MTARVRRPEPPWYVRREEAALRPKLRPSPVSSRVGLAGLAAVVLGGAVAGCAKDAHVGCDGLEVAAAAAVAAAAPVPAGAADAEALVQRLAQERDAVRRARAALVSPEISVDAVHLERRLEARVTLLQRAFAAPTPTGPGAPVAAAPAPTSLSPDAAARLADNAKAIDAARDEALARCRAK